jgi:DeoR/GlpR family transcriptional regulator of sugar metabolism
MLQADRRRKILQMLEDKGTVSVSDLCEQFDVSDMTIRRDLLELDKKGLLRRVHGGAISNLGRSYEPPYQLRSTDSLEQKRAIGIEASNLILDGDSLALDVGTTTLEIARHLKDKTNLTIITASLLIANEISSSASLESGVRLILTGGIVRPGELSMVGHISENTYGEFHVDKAFIGVAGISLEDGLTEYNLEDARVKKELMKTAGQKIIVADSKKFARTTFYKIAPLTEADTIITDSEAPQDFIAELRKIGIEVIIAEKINTDLIKRGEDNGLG